MFRFVTLISVLAIVCGFVSLSLAEASEEEWKPIYDQIFKVKGESIGVEKTIELLHKLDELFEDKFPLEVHARARREQLDALLDLLQVNEERCTDTYVHSVKNLLWVNILRTNAYAYIEHQRDLQYALCHELSLSSLEEAVKNMNPEVKTDIEALVKSIDDGAKSSYYDYTDDDTYIAGLLSYIESKNPIEKIDHDSVKASIKQNVEDLCWKTVKDVRRPIIMYIAFHTVGHELVDVWDHRRNVCLNIINKIEDINERAYKALKSFKNKDSIGAKIKRKINAHKH